MKQLLPIILLTLFLPCLDMHSVRSGNATAEHICIRTGDGVLITLSAAQIAALGPHNLLAELVDDIGYPQHPENADQIIVMLNLNSIALGHLLHMSQLVGAQRAIHLQTLNTHIRSEVRLAWAYLDAFRQV